MKRGLRILVRGRVQGVGFRPFVVRLARSLGLSGEACNIPEGVEILLFGEKEAKARFLRDLRAKAPQASRIRSLTVSVLGEDFRYKQGNRPWRFRIRESRQGRPQTYLPPDMATCKKCLSEILDPQDLRYRYPFTNCTDCGPRYTVVEGLPYDRPKTSLVVFPMCPDCLREYRDPEDRRFHAEPNACPVCGPRIWITDRSGKTLEVEDPWEFIVRTLREGAVLAVRGLGGFHLVCDAENEDAVRKLRVRKHRPTKPFAVMVKDLDAARHLAELSLQEEKALLSREAPIVLVRKRRPFPLAESVAPGIHLIGIMLPYTPLHHLLLRAWPGLALVMTSGNLSDEPLSYRNEEALERLSGLADYFLLHNREIVAPVDDSVVRFSGKTRILIRRARGFVPDPLPLPEKAPPLLAVGPLLKNTFALTREKEAFLSPHLGDLEDLKTLKRFTETLEHYQRLLATTPRVVVSDLHPDYLSTRVAEEWAESRRLPHLKIQHHATHAYAALGEKANLRALAVVLDGAGLGTDGTIWGGEILLLDGQNYKRIGGLSPFLLPGGETAEREPWRVILYFLKKLGLEIPESLRQEVPEDHLRMVLFQTEKRLNTPLTTSAGRLFEAVAVLLGLGVRNHYEGELAMKLEALAETARAERPRSYELEIGKPRIPAEEIFRAVHQDLARGTPRELVALKFHLSLAEAFVEAVRLLAERYETNLVALSGGCFQNALFLGFALEGLRKAGLKPVFNSEIPPNDGGISYGQVVWASLVHPL